MYVRTMPQRALSFMKYVQLQDQPAVGQYLAIFEATTTRNLAQDKAEIIVAKQRQGPVGTVEVAFDRRITRFDNATLDEAPSDAPAVQSEETQTTFTE